MTGKKGQWKQARSIAELANRQAFSCGRADDMAGQAELEYQGLKSLSRKLEANKNAQSPDKDIERF